MEGLKSLCESIPFIVGIFSCFLCLLPLGIGWNLTSCTSSRCALASSMNSKEFSCAISSNLFLTIPVFIYLACDSTKLLRTDWNPFIYSTMLVTSLILPDLLLLFFGIPSQNVEFSLCIFEARYIMIVCAILGLLNCKGKNLWSRFIVMLISILCGVGSIIKVYLSFTTGEELFPLKFIGYSLSIFGVCFHLYLYLKCINMLTIQRTQKGNNTNEDITAMYCAMLSSALSFYLVSCWTLYFSLGSASWIDNQYWYLPLYTFMEAIFTMALGMMPAILLKVESSRYQVFCFITSYSWIIILFLLIFDFM